MFETNFDFFLKILGIISLSLGIFWGIYRFYTEFIISKTKRHKYHKLYQLIENWFDEIDKNLERDLNFSKLNNMEKKIRLYITDNKLLQSKLKFTKKFRIKFLGSCGIKKELSYNKELFCKYGRCPYNWIFLDIYINQLISSFYIFLNNYKSKNVNTNFAEVEMRIKLLRMYWKIKEPDYSS